MIQHDERENGALRRLLVREVDTKLIDALNQQERKTAASQHYGIYLAGLRHPRLGDLMNAMLRNVNILPGRENDANSITRALATESRAQENTNKVVFQTLYEVYGNGEASRFQREYEKRLANRSANKWVPEITPQEWAVQLSDKCTFLGFSHDTTKDKYHVHAEASQGHKIKAGDHLKNLAAALNNLAYGDAIAKDFRSRNKTELQKTYGEQGLLAAKALGEIIEKGGSLKASSGKDITAAFEKIQPELVRMFSAAIEARHPPHSR